MQIDNNALMKILSMNDDELKKVIAAAAGEGGIPLPNISAADIARLRTALGGIGCDPNAMSEILNAASETQKKR